MTLTDDGVAVCVCVCECECVCVCVCVNCMRLTFLNLFTYNVYTWLIVVFCLFVNALYEWNVAKTNSCVHLNVTANKYPCILVCVCGGGGEVEGGGLECITSWDQAGALWSPSPFTHPSTRPCRPMLICRWFTLTRARQNLQNYDYQFVIARVSLDGCATGICHQADRPLPICQSTLPGKCL